MEKPVWNILLVDDDEDDYLITRTMLAETQWARCKLEWASTYEAGKRALQNHTFDAVLMDYDLGAGTGLDLIRECSAVGCEYPIILLTGRGSHEVDVEAMQAGATMYLTKDEVNALLLERVIRYAIEMKQKERAIRYAEENLSRQSERQALLLEVTDLILKAGQDRASLTKMIFDKVSGHLNADVCFNYQLESDEGPLRLVAGFGIPAEQWESSQVLSLGQAFCGTVAATKKAISADEQRIQTDEKGAFIRGMGVRAYACHPLFDRSGQVLGTLSIASTRRSSFTREEVNFLQTLCHFVALAWENSDPK